MLKLCLLTAFIGHLMCWYCDCLITYTPDGRFSAKMLNDNEQLSEGCAAEKTDAFYYAWCFCTYHVILWISCSERVDAAVFKRLCIYYADRCCLVYDLCDTASCDMRSGGMALY